MSDEPIIQQLMPADNWWIVYKDEKGKKFYSKAAFFALVNNVDHQDIVPIDFDMNGIWDLYSQNRDGWIYSETQPKDED